MEFVMPLYLFYMYFSCQEPKTSIEPSTPTDENPIDSVDPQPSEEPIVEISEEPTDSGITTDPNDIDNDGYVSELDCNDQNAAIHPDAEEICDSIDNNCDGFVDPEELCGPATIVVLDGFDGTIYTSHDSGANWEITGVVPFYTPAKVAFAQNGNGLTKNLQKYRFFNSIYLLGPISSNNPPANPNLLVHYSCKFFPPLA